MIDLVCPACNGAFRVGLARPGARARCPLCHRVFVVDDPDRQDHPADSRNLANGSRTGAVAVAVLLGLIALCTFVAALTTH